MTRQWTTCFAAVLLVAIAGVGTAQPESIEELRARAEQGDADAQSSLGLAYATGRGVSQDDAEAARWYRLAANQGEALAQYNLGFAYATGRGVPQDDAEAVRCYRLAGDQGNPSGQLNLGLMYATGRGVPQDYVQAYMWLSLSASRSSGETRDSAANSRDRAASRLTPDQLAEAQRLASEWDEAHPRD